MATGILQMHNLLINKAVAEVPFSVHARSEKNYKWLFLSRKQSYRKQTCLLRLLLYPSNLSVASQWFKHIVTEYR